MEQTLKAKNNRDHLPHNPATYYRESGWQGWAHLLGQQSADITDPRDPTSVLLALLPVVVGNDELWWEEKLIREALSHAEAGPDG